MPDLDALHLADIAISDIVDCLRHRRVRAALHADLDDPLVATGSIHHRAALFDRLAGGLLAVDMLAGLAGHDGHDRMPMIRCPDGDGVDVLTVENAAEILVEGGRALGHFAGSLREV